MLPPSPCLVSRACRPRIREPPVVGGKSPGPQCCLPLPAWSAAHAGRVSVNRQWWEARAPGPHAVGYATLGVEWKENGVWGSCRCHSPCDLLTKAPAFSVGMFSLSWDPPWSCSGWSECLPSRSTHRVFYDSFIGMEFIYRSIQPCKVCSSIIFLIFTELYNQHTILEHFITSKKQNQNKQTNPPIPISYHPTLTPDHSQPWLSTNTLSLSIDLTTWAFHVNGIIISAFPVLCSYLLLPLHSAICLFGLGACRWLTLHTAFLVCWLCIHSSNVSATSVNMKHERVDCNGTFGNTETKLFLSVRPHCWGN